jgi:putative Mg2+ transporter-C (MgtC) family protein
VDLQFDWQMIAGTLAKLVTAYLLTLPIAWEREKHARSAGLRTFPLVAVASCGYMIFSIDLFAGAEEAQARLVQGLMTGIGFIGGGAILKSRGSVHGTATAASIWNTGAVGTAVAYGRFEIAVILSAMNFFTLQWLTPLKPGENGDEARHS